jgi:PAS domain S-box-containing protein
MFFLSHVKGPLMHFRSSKSNNSLAISGAFGPKIPTKVDARIFGSVQDLSKPFPAIYLTNPVPWHMTRERLLELRNFPVDGAGARIPHGSRFGAMMDEEEMEHDLHQARENFGTIFHASPAILCILRLNGLQYLEINKAYEGHTGYSRNEVLGRASLRLGLWKKAEDRKRMICRVLAKGSLRGRQVIFQTKTGEPLITFLSAEIIEFGGEACVLIIGEDITMRRQAEEARMDLAQRLINAQEAERTRVARELHDNVGHSLALFTIELDRTRLAMNDLSADNDARFARLSIKLKTLGRDVSNLSHQLHSSELELLGLPVAIKALCREFSEQYRVQAHCECSGAFDKLPGEVSLCLFRVVQEALRNVAKHSRATKVDIEMHETRKTLHLSLSDDGIGFASDISAPRAGLGLVSMRERLHLIGGRFTISSKAGCGTRVEATVSLSHTNPAPVS